MGKTVSVFFQASGSVVNIYDESLNLGFLGKPKTQRASHVEPDDANDWWADMTPVGGPVLGPYARRSDALRAEHDYLTDMLRRQSCN